VSTASVVPRAPSGEVEADLAHAEHRRAVDARLHEAIEAGARTLGETLAATEGADPRLVAQRLHALGLATEREPTEASGSGEVSEPWVPELHARDFEWYFTPACAAELAARVGGPGRSVLCLGTPTVAFALLETGHVRRVTLVDRTPFAFRRDHGLAFRRHRDAAALEARQEDLAAARLDAGAYDVAVLDAPWYLPALCHWLAVAAAAVRPGGRILLALLPALHRPSAQADRATILARARALGPVTVEPGRLRYATPRFEREALATAGLWVPAAWRRADLVELVVERPSTARYEAPAPEPAWARFVVGTQVIQLDPCAPSGPGELLGPLDGHADFRYGSISTRDPRRADIGLWTSRSRVARVRRPAVVAALLERLAATGELRALADAPVLRSVPAPERARMLDALGTIVGPLPPTSPSIAPGDPFDAA
jgi:SAM-dependent methyltransferase